MLLATLFALVSVATGIVAALVYADWTAALAAVGCGIGFWPLMELEQHVFATRIAEQLPAFVAAGVAARKVAAERYATPTTSARHCDPDERCNVKAELSPSMQRLADNINVVTVEGEPVVYFGVQRGTRRIVVYSPASPQDRPMGPFEPVGNGLFVHLSPGG